MMADMLEEILIDGGYEVCGIVRTVKDGISLARSCKPDLALLDIGLADGGIGTDIAAAIDRSGGLGVLYATGNASAAALTQTNGEAWLSKPYRAADILRSLQIVEEIVSTGQASPPFPRGLHILRRSAEAATEVRARGLDWRAPPAARLLRQQAALAAFGGYALQETSLDKILTEAARICAESLGVQFCKVCRYRPEENDLMVEAGVGWKPGVVGTVVSRADSSSPHGRAFTTGEAVICNDLAKDASFAPPPFYAEHGIVSTVDVIIKSKAGQPWGVLEIDNPVGHIYDDHDVDFLTGFANVLAEAVNSVKRNANYQRTLAQLRDMVAQRDKLLSVQLELLEEKAILAQELQHRVRNNLQLVHGMLSKELAVSPADDYRKDGVRAIARRVLALSTVYDHLLSVGLSRTIDFGRYLYSLCTSLKEIGPPNQADIELTCEVEQLTLCLDDATALGLIVVELISNSFNHAFPAGTGAILVTLRGDKSGLCGQLDIVDNGTGFTKTIGCKRRGLGLVKRLMEQLDGTLEVQSKRGTAWTLRFPLKAAVIAPIVGVRWQDQPDVHQMSRTGV